VKGKDKYHQDGSVLMTANAESYPMNILKLNLDKDCREFEMYVLDNTKGQLVFVPLGTVWQSNIVYIQG